MCTILYYNIDSNYTLLNYGPVCATPKIGCAAQNGRIKNEMVTKGLMYCHDYFILIGDSPGYHYNKYSKILTRENCLSFDPRDIKYSALTTHKKEFFTRDSFNIVRDIINDCKIKGRDVLIRIDIRKDKPLGVDTSIGINDTWETWVHEDNLLTRDLIDNTDDNVTLMCKLRPCFRMDLKDFVIEFKRPVRILPLPYLKVSSAEFTIFVPKSRLLKSTSDVIYRISYAELIIMSHQVCAIKRIIGPSYNMYCCDLYLHAGVIIGEVGIMNSMMALHSLSNISNANVFNNVQGLLACKGYCISYPYCPIFSANSRYNVQFREYNDHAFNLFDEAIHDDDSRVIIPISSLNFKSSVSYQDMINVLITDDINIISYKQPADQISTQIVKLVSFILTDIFKEAGLDFREIDSAIRSSVIREFVVANKIDDYRMLDRKTIQMGCSGPGA